MDFTAIKYSGKGSFRVKEGTIDKLLFLPKTIGIYTQQVLIILTWNGPLMQMMPLHLHVNKNQIMIWSYRGSK